MKIIIIAADVHIGGGRVVLNDLLNAALTLAHIEFYALVDTRFERDSNKFKNVTFIDIAKSKRIFFVNRVISNLVDQEDVILNVSGLPFFRRFPCTKVQYIMNRYFIDNYSTSGLLLVVRLRLFVQKLAFSRYLKFADYIFVQNSVMSDLLLELGFNKDTIEVIPFKDVDKIISSGQKLKDSFIYVASHEAHKNHLNLIEAWIIMAKKNIYPTLLLTIDEDSSLCRDILVQIKKYNLKIVIKSGLQRNDLLSCYDTVSALIYPSFFECFGIPLLEAKNYNLPVIAAELDYVRDFINPVETFDPNSPKSISRAVRRFLCRDEKSISVLTANEFTKEIVLYANK